MQVRFGNILTAAAGAGIVANRDIPAGVGLGLIGTGLGMKFYKKYQKDQRQQHQSWQPYLQQ
jgi:hypothetical protein